MKRYLIDQVTKVVNYCDHMYSSLAPSVLGSAAFIVNENLEKILIKGSVIATLSIASYLVGGVIYKKAKTIKERKIKNKIEAVQEQ
ncbi:MAG: hypothetical protein PHS54_01670 [Clostridia bacterium]|nr:hypothetical protein [Clostridia bacterium]